MNSIQKKIQKPAYCVAGHSPSEWVAVYRAAGGRVLTLRGWKRRRGKNGEGMMNLVLGGGEAVGKMVRR
jgi:hypothetical protein